jgi:hypothetical protein
MLLERVICYMPVRILYNLKPPIWVLIAIPDREGDFKCIKYQLAIFLDCRFLLPPFGACAW